jgi:hypothetical protein
MLHDHKVVLLDDEQHRFWINCLLMAGSLEKDGALGSAEDISCVVRKPLSATRRLLGVLQRAGMVTAIHSVWMITNFAKRQGKPSDRAANVRERVRRYRSNPENRAKDHARSMAATAIRLGRLVRQPCEECGRANTEAHHDDYSKPLEVRWLCKHHHQSLHHKLDWLRNNPETPPETPSAFRNTPVSPKKRREEKREEEKEKEKEQKHASPSGAGSQNQSDRHKYVKGKYAEFIEH